MTETTDPQAAPLTDRQLDDIRARAEVATDGPWVLTDDLDGDGYPGHLWVVRTPASGPDEPDEHSAVVSIGDRALGEFIAHAPQDIAALLAEVRRLRTQLAAVHGLCDEQDQVARMLEFATPPWIRAVRAVVQSADVDEMTASLRRDGFGPDQIATMLRRATDEAPAPSRLAGKAQQPDTEDGRCPALFDQFSSHHEMRRLDPDSPERCAYCGKTDAPAAVSQPSKEA